MNSSLNQILELARQHTDLGHEKRNACFLRQVELVMKSPGTSLPQAAGRQGSAWNNLMSCYRFADNPNICLKDLRHTRIQMVTDRIPPESEVLVIHDVSLMNFSLHNSKQDRREIGDHRGMGYEYVCCAAVDPHALTFWGVLHDTVINSKGPDDTDSMDYDYEALFQNFSEPEKQRLHENHRHQMAVHVNGLTPYLQNQHTIHVADREFDDIFTMHRCLANNTNFVIRSSGNRNVQVPAAEWIPSHCLAPHLSGHEAKPGWVSVNMKSFVQAIPMQPYKDLPLDHLDRVTDPRTAVRTARLSIGSCSVRLYRKCKRNKQYFLPPAPLQLNMVVIRETDPPEGVEPLLWVLFTTLPVGTFDQLFYVGQIYETRWKIEDFFKLMKTSFHLEAFRFNNATKIAKMLIVFTIVAMAILQLKSHLDLPSGGYLDDENYRNLKLALSNLNNPDIDLEWRLLAFIATSGGWIGRRRDPLGPTVLMRGLDRVISQLEALSNNTLFIKELIAAPQLLGGFFCV